MAKDDLVFSLVTKMPSENLTEILEALDHLGVCTIGCLCRCTKAQLKGAGLSKALADKMEAMLMDEYGELLAYEETREAFSRQEPPVFKGSKEGSAKPGTGAPPCGPGDRLL